MLARHNITFKAVKHELARDYGLTIRRRDGEYRVNFYKAPEAIAYYTTDLNDAYVTGVVMGERGYARAMDGLRDD